MSFNPITMTRDLAISSKLWVSDFRMKVNFRKLPPGMAACYDPKTNSINLPAVNFHELNYDQVRKYNALSFHERKHYLMSDCAPYALDNPKLLQFILNIIEDCRIELSPHFHLSGDHADLLWYYQNVEVPDYVKKWDEVCNGNPHGAAMFAINFKICGYADFPIPAKLQKIFDIAWKIMNDGRFHASLEMKKEGTNVSYRLAKEIYEAWKQEDKKQEQKKNSENKSEENKSGKGKSEDQPQKKKQSKSEKTEEEPEDEDRSGSGITEEESDEEEPDDEDQGDNSSEGDEDDTDTDADPDSGDPDADPESDVSQPASAGDIDKQFEAAQKDEATKIDKEKLNKQFSTPEMHEGKPYVAPPIFVQEKKLVPDSDTYNKSYAKISKMIASFKNEIVRNALAKDDVDTETHLLYGELDENRLHAVAQGETRVFQTIDEIEIENSVWDLVLDMSGSMNGRKAYLAFQTIILLSEALSLLQIPFAIGGYTTCDNPERCFTGVSADFGVAHYIFKKFDEPFSNDVRYQLAAASKNPGRDNADHEVIRVRAADLYMQPRPRKIQVVICDGLPQVWSMDSRVLYDELKKTNQTIKKAGIEQFCFGMFDGGYMGDVKEFYENYCIIRETQELEEKALKLLANFLLKGQLKI